MQLRNLASLLLVSTFCLRAEAQSSVTLYGTIDNGLVYVSNAGGHSQYAATSGTSVPNRWGLKGSEDLGGGLKANFDLENSYSSTNGNIGYNGLEFGRAAWVGLSNSYGNIRIGRQLTPISLIVGEFESGATWAGSGAEYGAHPGDSDNFDDTNRVNNAISVVTYPAAGIVVSGLYSLGGVAGDVTRNQIISVAASYDHGPFKAAAGYQVERDPNYGFYGAAAGSTTQDNMLGPVIDGYATAHSHQTIGAATSYALGPVTLGAVYSHVSYLDLGGEPVAGLNPIEAAYRGTATFNTGEVNARYSVTPSVLLGAAYIYSRGGTDATTARYNQVNLDADYLLSKATSVYALFVYQHASGIDSTGERARAVIGFATTPSTSGNQSIFTIGLKHAF